MKGIKLAKEFYLKEWLPLLHEKAPELENKIAIGLIGSGSECYGFDDELSQDHDFEPGFYIFIPDDFSEKDEFKLEHLYNLLPLSFNGYERKKLIPGDNSKYGVIRISEFYSSKIGKNIDQMKLSDWLNIPSFYLLEATNGEVFIDNLGEFTRIRNLLKTYPADIIKKKLAGELILLYQSGIYNFKRSYQRADLGATQLSVIEFVKHAIQLIYLINEKYTPYYKWQFRGLKQLNLLSNLHNDLLFLISSDNTESSFNEKCYKIEQIINTIKNELLEKYNLPSSLNELDTIAFCINDLIEDEEIRNLNILSGTN